MDQTARANSGYLDSRHSSFKQYAPHQCMLTPRMFFCTCSKCDKQLGILWRTVELFCWLTPASRFSELHYVSESGKSEVDSHTKGHHRRQELRVAYARNLLEWKVHQHQAEHPQCANIRCKLHLLTMTFVTALAAGHYINSQHSSLEFDRGICSSANKQHRKLLSWERQQFLRVGEKKI